MTLEEILKDRHFKKTRRVKIYLDKELDVHFKEGFFITELSESGTDEKGKEWRRYQLVWLEPSKYEKLVSTLIRDKYSIDHELAILRQQHEKPEEFIEYNNYAELCKATAKEFIKERESAFERRMIL